MDALKNFIIALLGWSIVIGTSVLVMIFGWGLYPKNWLLVILGNSLAFVVGQLVIAVTKVK